MRVSTREIIVSPFLFLNSLSPLLFDRCFLLLYSPFLPHYSRLAHSLLPRYFIALLYNHFSRFSSTSFCREPHICCLFSPGDYTYRGFVLMRSTRQEYHVCGMSVKVLFFLFPFSHISFCSLHLILQKASRHLLVPSFKRTYKGKFMRRLLHRLPVQSNCKVDWKWRNYMRPQLSNVSPENPFSLSNFSKKGR